MTEYRFTFNGKLHPTAEPLFVAEKLAKQFGIKIESIMPILQGRAYFERKGLNEFTAKAYKQLFFDAGALGYVEEITKSGLQATTKPGITSKTQRDIRLKTIPSAAGEPLTRKETHDQKTNPPACPKCGSTDIGSESCNACGIYFAKYRSTNNRQAESTDQDASGCGHLTVNSESTEERKATKWLSIGSLILLIAITADSYLQYLVTPTSAGIDIGYVPFIVGYLVLLRGCFLYARQKGYGNAVGLLGLASLAGLAVLLLLPDKERPQAKPRPRQLVIAIASIGLFTYWLWGFTYSTKSLIDLEQGRAALQQGRSEYPSAVLDSDNQIYKYKEEEIISFLNKAITIVDEQKLRPDSVSEVGDIAFAELARYQNWRNYQTFLHIQQGIELPAALQNDAVKRHDRNIAELLAQINRDSSHERLVQSKDDWMVGVRPEVSSDFWLKLNNNLNKVWEMSRNQMYMVVDRNSDGMPHLDLTQLDLHNNDHITVETTSNTVTYSAPVGPLAKNKLVVVFYLKPGKAKRPTWLRRDEPTTHYILAVGVISPQFPNKYLYGGIFNSLQRFQYIPDDF